MYIAFLDIMLLHTYYRLQYSINIYSINMTYWETTKCMWLTLLWYLLYCGGLEPNPQYICVLYMYIKATLWWTTYSWGFLKIPIWQCLNTGFKPFTFNVYILILLGFSSNIFSCVSPLFLISLWRPFEFQLTQA